MQVRGIQASLNADTVLVLHGISAFTVGEAAITQGSTAVPASEVRDLGAGYARVKWSQADLQALQVGRAGWDLVIQQGADRLRVASGTVSVVRGAAGGVVVTDFDGGSPARPLDTLDGGSPSKPIDTADGGTP